MVKHYSKILTDEVHLHDILGAKKASDKPFSKKHKFDIEFIIGDRIGRDGKFVYAYQVINRTKNFYKKFVKQRNSVIKDVEGKLSEHKE